MVVETLLGIAIAVGVIGVILVIDCLLGRVRVQTPDVACVTVLVCRGEAGGLEGRLRDGRAGKAAVILDAGMSPEALSRARLLALRFGATLTDGEALTEELRRYL